MKLCRYRNIINSHLLNTKFLKNRKVHFQEIFCWIRQSSIIYPWFCSHFYSQTFHQQMPLSSIWFHHTEASLINMIAFMLLFVVQHHHFVMNIWIGNKSLFMMILIQVPMYWSFFIQFLQQKYNLILNIQQGK